MLGRSFAILATIAALAACDRDMSEQAKYKPYGEAPALPGNMALQSPPEGTVARGDIARAAILSERPAMSTALLSRGRERFDIFCAPCHGRAGDGQGVIVQRGFPAPPTYHQDRLRTLSDRDIVDVVTRGYGAMFGYADRVEPSDRWAIVAYIRALQLSQQANVSQLPPDLQQRLETLSP